MEPRICAPPAINVDPNFHPIVQTAGWPRFAVQNLGLGFPSRARAVLVPVSILVLYE